MTDHLRDYFRQPPTSFTGEIKLDEPLARYTYYQIGGPAAVLAIPRSIADLEWIWNGIQKFRASVFTLGAGSNILISDQGFDGVVIRMNKLNQELRADGNQLVSGGSVMISMLLRKATQEGWGGLEFLTGIPGSVGGAVRMNAGTHLGESCTRLTRVEALVGDSRLEKRTYESSDLRFEYRKNLFLPENAFVWAAHWKIDPEEPSVVKARLDETLLRRKQTQPIDYPSCGSVFKNPKASAPEGLRSAWQVLDRLGLRGHQIGGAQIAEKHSNFIINLGGARAQDVRDLIQLAKTRARQELGIELQEEVIYVPHS